MNKGNGELLINTPVFNFTGTVDSAHNLIKALVDQYKDKPISNRMKRTIEILKNGSRYQEPIKRIVIEDVKDKVERVSDFTKEVVEAKTGVSLEDAVKMLS